MEKNSQQKIYVNEVSPRDGFQNEEVFIDTPDKVAFINKLSECGLAKIEVTSFTSPKAIPALADAKEVASKIKRNPNIVYTALVPNMRGAKRALECELDEVNLVLSVSESHNKANMRMSCQQSIEQLTEVIGLLKGSGIKVNVSLGTSFGCPIEGDISVAAVFKIAEQFAAQGINSLTLCDTTGMAYPTQVFSIAKRAIDVFHELEIVMHFHNTRGMALANVIASLQAGIIRFDAAVGGLGGCPYAPGASGNLCTEELVHMLDLMGYNTGININKLLAVSRGLPSLVGRETPSQVAKAGLRTDLQVLTPV